MQTAEYKFIREALERILGQKQLFADADVARAREAVEIVEELESISTLSVKPQPGRFISMEEARKKRQVFKDEFGSDNSKLPAILRFKSLLISPDLLTQLAKFKKNNIKTELIQAFPACDYDEVDGKKIPTNYTQVFVAMDADGKPILGSDMDATVLAKINNGISNTRFIVAAGKDAADEIRICPPDPCTDIV